MTDRSRTKKGLRPQRQERSYADTLKELESKKRRRRILFALLITAIVIAAIAIGIITAPTLPGVLVVHIYDAAAFHPPCPSPVSPLLVDATITLSGPTSRTVTNVKGLIAFDRAPPGLYQVTGIATGYAQDSETAGVTSSNTTHVCLALVRTG